MQSFRIKKIIACYLFLTGIPFGSGLDWTHASMFQNSAVGTANGPEGQTNVQTLADFENDELFSGRDSKTAHMTPERFYFLDSDKFNLSLSNCGPSQSKKCLKIDNLVGAYNNYGGWKYIQLWWQGPRKGEQVYMKEGRRANSHSIWIKGFDELQGDSRQNFTLGGYAKRRTPGTLSSEEPESNNMHEYWQSKVNWGGSSSGVWRKLVYRTNPTHQRSESYLGAYDAFSSFASIYRDNTRFYYQWDCGNSECQPNSVYLDNLIFYYENPFLAAWPNTRTVRAKPGSEVTQQVIVWNTHPTETRSYTIKASGWRSNGVAWKGKKSEISVSANTTGPLEPGKGFLFTVTYLVPSAVEDGSTGEILLNIFRNGSEVLNSHLYQLANPQGNHYQNRFDLLGVGVAIKTRIDSALLPSPPPGLLTNLSMESVGGSWADISWTSPANTQDTKETSTDPSSSTYAIRYSPTPITTEEAWNAAVPVEEIPPVFGPNITQEYTLRGLKSSSTYYVAVRTYNDSFIASPISAIPFSTTAQDIDAGSGANSNPNIDQTPPSSPTNLQLN